MVHGLGFSNDLIAADESSHCDFGCLLYSMLSYKLPQSKIYEILQDAIDVECEFVRDSLPVELIGMNSKHMIQYIKFVSDRLLRVLQYQPLYNVENPFEWMDAISMERKVNFFEGRVSSYQKLGVKNKDPKIFTLEEEF